MKIPLFVIKKLDVDQYWACSTEHGTGWSPQPKQSFSPSELVREIRRLIDEGWYQDLQILRASIEPLPSIKPLSGQASQAPQGAADRAPEQSHSEPTKEPKAKVYSRPECIFNYCPHPGTCQASNRCETPARNEASR